MSNPTRAGSRARVLPFELLLLVSLVAVGAHADIITFNSTSPRIQYQGPWSTSDDFRVSLSKSQTFAVFWSGTGIRVQGKVQGNESAILFSLDNTTPAPLDPGPDEMEYSFSGLESRDHQLLMSRLPSSNVTTNFYLFSITLERDRLGQESGTPLFDPYYMGTTATKVPSNAVLIDDTWPEVHTIGKWTCWEYSQPPPTAPNYWYNNSATETVNEGDSLTFKFHGSSIWIFGTKNSSGGESDVYIDGNKLGVINSYGYEVQGLLWSREGLSDSKHDLQIITRRCPPACPACGGACLSIDFFRILSSTTPYGAVTDHPVPSPTDDGYRDGYRDGDYYDGLSVRNASSIIAGVIGGTLFVLLTSLGTFAWQRLFAPP